MGYITLTISKEEVTKDYILFYAEYLNESWLAEVKPDDTTSIIRQFKCKKLENCFEEAVSVISHLGEVTKIELTEIDERFGELFESQLKKRYQTIPSNTNLGTFNREFTKQNIWNWLSQSLPGVHFAN